jgi:hypothetical protein
MAYEYPTSLGILRLRQIRRVWCLEFRGARHGRWRSADAAARAVARHESGLSAWDQHRPEISDDLLDWRPLGESL